MMGGERVVHFYELGPPSSMYINFVSGRVTHFLLRKFKIIDSIRYSKLIIQ